jgi:glycosyltransferase involved in cell wall biosynthesis
MSEDIDLSLILPAFNEAARIEETINQTVSYLRKHGN